MARKSPLHLLQISLLFLGPDGTWAACWSIIALSIAPLLPSNISLFVYFTGLLTLGLAISLGVLNYLKSFDKNRIDAELALRAHSRAARGYGFLKSFLLLLNSTHVFFLLVAATLLLFNFYTWAAEYDLGFTKERIDRDPLVVNDALVRTVLTPLPLVILLILLTDVAAKYVRGFSSGNENVKDAVLFDRERGQNTAADTIIINARVDNGSLSLEKEAIQISTSKTNQHIRGSLQEYILASTTPGKNEELGQYRTLIYADIINRFKSIRIRFLSELENLKRRGNVNLVLGMFVSCIGILFLGWATLSLSHVSPKPPVIASYFLPRLSFVISIEIIAFFFLNLYKSSMIDIKYFQNELTNIEARLVSVQAAVMSGADDLVSAVVQVMATTERNFRLGRGESTVEIEREKIGQDATVRAMEKFMAMVKEGSKGST